MVFCRFDYQSPAVSETLWFMICLSLRGRCYFGFALLAISLSVRCDFLYVLLRPGTGSDLLDSHACSGHEPAVFTHYVLNSKLYLIISRLSVINCSQPLLRCWTGDYLVHPAQLQPDLLKLSAITSRYFIALSVGDASPNDLAASVGAMWMTPFRVGRQLIQK